DSFAAITGGSGAFSSTGVVRGTLAFQDYFFVDGTSDYRWFDLSDDAIEDWDAAVTAGSLPVGSVDSTLGCSIAATYRGRVVLS
ncbi:hypothetical protein, partial [Burkholderia sp. SIMBA_024]|uniref:hypothetical protein n=1 Tax=Burkholderia sp. SIMBA_024 TaxID=3085768 RepID=UPI003978E96F